MINLRGTHIGKCSVYNLFDCIVTFYVQFVKKWSDGVIIGEESEPRGIFHNIDLSVFGKLRRRAGVGVGVVVPTATATTGVHRRRTESL